jgi:hypothetical protein
MNISKAGDQFGELLDKVAQTALPYSTDDSGYIKNLDEAIKNTHKNQLMIEWLEEISRKSSRIRYEFFTTKTNHYSMTERQKNSIKYLLSEINGLSSELLEIWETGRVPEARVLK